MPEKREAVPLTPMAKELLARLVETYHPMPKSHICCLALEAGLRQIAVPSGPMSAVRLPMGEVF